VLLSGAASLYPTYGLFQITAFQDLRRLPDNSISSQTGSDNSQAADRLLLKVDEQCQLLANSNQQPPGRLTPRDRSGSPILVKGATLSSTGWFWMALRWCASFTVLGI
jgi:hypothetical protein